MSEPKSKATNATDSSADDGLQNFYFPEANEGFGGTVRAKDQADADKQVAAGNFVNANVAPQDAGEDKAA